MLDQIHSSIQDYPKMSSITKHWTPCILRLSNFYSIHASIILVLSTVCWNIEASTCLIRTWNEGLVRTVSIRLQRSNGHGIIAKLTIHHICRISLRGWWPFDSPLCKLRTWNSRKVPFPSACARTHTRAPPSCTSSPNVDGSSRLRLDALACRFSVIAWWPRSIDSGTLSDAWRAGLGILTGGRCNWRKGSCASWIVERESDAVEWVSFLYDQASRWSRDMDMSVNRPCFAWRRKIESVGLNKQMRGMQQTVTEWRRRGNG